MAFDGFMAEIMAAAEAQPHQVELPPTVPGLTLHVDGDYLAYYASGNEDTSPGQARQNALDLLDIYRTRTGSDNIVVHNTAKGCQKGERYLIATVKPYQAQRAGGHKPKNHDYLQEWLQTYEGPHFKVKNWATREADDGMAACAHFAVGKSPGYAAIATADKDMQVFPGLHIDWKTFELVRVPPGCYEMYGSQREKGDGSFKAAKMYGLKFFWLQMLMGDTADHIPGLPGYVAENDKKGKFFKPIGEKTALAFLSDTENSLQAYAMVSKLYQEYYDLKGENWQDHFCEQAALLWMRCDNTAIVGDFARHKGHSCISKPFDDDMWAAVARLEQRVKDKRAEINSFADRPI